MYKIAYATGSRADYGIVRNYLKKLDADENINLEILVTGTLLEEEFGNAVTIIEKDHFDISLKVPLHLNIDTTSGIINSMSIALKKFGEFFEDRKYDLLIILGDRYEMLSVAIAAAMNKIKILHIHGGEITLGNYDEFIRHSITKMSYFHFTSTEKYRKRVIQLGENPIRVCNIGAMGAENCYKIRRENVEKKVLDLKPKTYFVVLFHPETLTEVNIKQQMEELLEAIDCFLNQYQFVFIGSNADTSSNIIREQIHVFVQKNSRTEYFENLHPDSYHYLIKNAIALIGNSSSGLIEAPTLGTYTINIGDRQRGRERGESVFDISCNSKDIIESINKVINLPVKNRFFNPYFKVDASENAYKKTLEYLKMNNGVKDFFDLGDK